MGIVVLKVMVCSFVGCLMGSGCRSRVLVSWNVVRYDLVVRVSDRIIIDVIVCVVSRCFRLSLVLRSRVLS